MKRPKARSVTKNGGAGWVAEAGADDVSLVFQERAEDRECFRELVACCFVGSRY